jgi:hypothetical protein
MSDEASKLAEEQKSACKCPSGRDVFRKLSFSIIGFFVTSVLFFVALSDIRSYMEDYNINYIFVNFIAIFSLLIVFFLLPKLILRLFNCDDALTYYAVGVVLAVIYSLVVMFVLYPFIIPLRGEERHALWTTVGVWLATIIIINLLLSDTSKEIYKGSKERGLIKW